MSITAVQDYDSGSNASKCSVRTTVTVTMKNDLKEKTDVIEVNWSTSTVPQQSRIHTRDATDVYASASSLTGSAVSQASIPRYAIPGTAFQLTDFALEADKNQEKVLHMIHQINS